MIEAQTQSKSSLSVEHNVKNSVSHFGGLRKLWQRWSLPEIASRTIATIDWSDDLYVYHHLGLGDMIHCNGMVRFLLEKLDPNARIHVFCKVRNSAMVCWMFRDDPRIVIEQVTEADKERIQVDRVMHERRSSNLFVVGHSALRALEAAFPKDFFDILFYRQAGIPYKVRYSHCFWERDEGEEDRVFRKLAPSCEYVFVHDDPTRGYRIDTSSMTMPVIRNDVTESIFHLGKVLENARQVHCMESSIRCMLESLDLSRTELFYHNFRYPDRPLGKATCHQWSEISYPNGVTS